VVQRNSPPCPKCPPALGQSLFGLTVDLKLNHQVSSIFGFPTAQTSNTISFYVDGILLNVIKLYIFIVASSIKKKAEAICPVMATAWILYKYNQTGGGRINLLRSMGRNELLISDSFSCNVFVMFPSLVFYFIPTVTY